MLNALETYLHAVSTVESFFLEHSTVCVWERHMRVRPGENLLSPSTSSLSLSAHTHSMLTLEKMQCDWHGDTLLFLFESLKVLPREVIA